MTQSESLLTRTRDLSVAPLLTESLATAVFALSVSNRPDQVATDTLVALERRGLAAQNGVVRLNDALRRSLASELASEHPGRYRAVAGAIADHIREVADDHLLTALGPETAGILQSVMEIATDSSEMPTAFQELVGRIRESVEHGRQGDARIAARFLEELPTAPVRHRQLDFLRAMDYWVRQDRAAALPLLRKVYTPRVLDRAHAIVAHLLAVSEKDRGESQRAHELATESLELLEQLGDIQGESQVLSTLGVIERELESIAFEEGREPDVDARSTMERAIELADRLSIRQSLEARRILVSVLNRRGDFDEALALAEETAERIPEASADIRLALLTLQSSAARSAGRFDEAREYAHEGVRLARDLGETLELAKLLNVASAVDRPIDAEGAIALAQESVEIGDSIRNIRHASHARHTLARALLESGDAEAAREQAEMSLRLLQALNDTRGIKMVENTLMLIRQRSQAG